MYSAIKEVLTPADNLVEPQDREAPRKKQVTGTPSYVKRLGGEKSLVTANRLVGASWGRGDVGRGTASGGQLGDPVVGVMREF